MKQLIAYHVGGEPFEIRRAPRTREWMDKTREKYAYRCLPLVAANIYGWELLCPEEFEATWDGSSGLDAITIVPSVPFAVSHFGYGILTFHIPYLFRTSEDADLMVTGPVNRYGKVATPLEGIVETSWSPMTFTMNWMFDWATALTFEKGEPICRIVPVARNFLEGFEPIIIANSDIPQQVRDDYEKWNKSRMKFNDDLKVDGSDAARAGWQRTYYKTAKVTKLPDFK